MSIETEITRLQGAKEAIKTSLTNKGVTVSDTAKLDEYSILVDSIEAGGGVDITDYFELDFSNSVQGQKYFHMCIKKIPEGFDTSNAQYLDYFLTNNPLITEIPQLNTSNCKQFGSAFSWCIALITIPLLDFGKATTITNVLSNCIALENLGGFKDLGKAYETSKSAEYSQYKLDLSKSTKLSHESLMNVINNVCDIASLGIQPQTIVFGKTNLLKLTDAELQVLSDKGWLFA